MGKKLKISVSIQYSFAVVNLQYYIAVVESCTWQKTKRLQKN